MVSRIALTLCLAAGIATVASAQETTPAGTVAATVAPAWSWEQFNEAFTASGRKHKITEAEWNAVQEKRPAALAHIERYLTERLGKADPAVIKAFGDVPREYYHYHYEHKRDFIKEAYEDVAKPWAIGYGSALSDYLGQAYMTQLARPTKDMVVLEVGTGSGFQISLLSRLVKKAYSIEIIEPLGKGVAGIFKPLGYDNIETRVGDGYFGWPELGENHFDIIMVTCAAQYVPPALFKQLKPGGRMIIPIGQPFKRGQILYVYTKDKNGKVHSRKDVGVYFIPMTGEQMKNPQPGSAPAATPAAPAVK